MQNRNFLCCRCRCCGRCFYFLKFVLDVVAVDVVADVNLDVNCIKKSI
ncbi:hypothetical protein LEQ06_13530 [Paraclostridium sp. AKS46]|nr:hypothetical protein [Paraclostridium sp. AKS46]